MTKSYSRPIIIRILHGAVKNLMAFNYCNIITIVFELFYMVRCVEMCNR